MASTSSGAPSSAMEEKRNWVDMPDEIMGEMILQRLNCVEILTSDIIDMNHYSYDSYPTNDFKNLIKQAVHRSCGELVHISLKHFVTDDLLDYHKDPSVHSSSKVTRLRLKACYGITGCWLNNTLKRLSHLETLELSYTSILVEDIEVIGHNCPLSLNPSR
ncbi:LOW QUALITY PROTEIN: hypothetical protein OSB04_002025 [Centaurea solstitialis]|uniref:Uncharacterized protein n=1 Tax=Centaurea solstitialis TaxID=347529 RepID=A0AA38WUP5_9ASTR|nr:LOW QUALITY PROTEIN: hypothetical protein OSB04_002025 [Centaurea solstitialis]